MLDVLTSQSRSYTPTDDESMVEQKLRTANAKAAGTSMVFPSKLKRQATKGALMGDEHKAECTLQRYMQVRLSAQMSERERELKRAEDPNAVADGKESDELRAAALRHVAFRRSNRGACYCCLSDEELQRRHNDLQKLMDRATELFANEANSVTDVRTPPKAEDVRSAMEGFITWVRTAKTQIMEPEKQFVSALASH